MPVNHPLIFMTTGNKNWSMITAKTDIITRLKMDILPLEGLRMSMAGEALDAGLGPMNQAFPQGSFPLAAIHEFISTGPESAAATSGFISALVSPLMKKGGAVHLDRILRKDISASPSTIWYRTGPNHLYRSAKRKGFAMGRRRSTEMPWACSSGC